MVSLDGSKAAPSGALWRCDSVGKCRKVDLPLKMAGLRAFRDDARRPVLRLLTATKHPSRRALDPANLKGNLKWPPRAVIC